MSTPTHSEKLSAVARRLLRRRQPRSLTVTIDVAALNEKATQEQLRHLAECDRTFARLWNPRPWNGG